MTYLPSPRPVRLAQQICRLAGVAYLMIGTAIVSILVMAPNLGAGMTGGDTLFSVKEGVWTSATLWWDGILNPLFHGTVFFVLASALGYVADLGDALIERDAEANLDEDGEPQVPTPVIGRQRPITIGDDIPSLTKDDLQPL